MNRHYSTEQIYLKIGSAYKEISEEKVKQIISDTLYAYSKHLLLSRNNEALQKGYQRSD